MPSLGGVRLALSWLTVLPVRAPEVDARTAARAITLAPLVGVLLGAAAAGALAGLHALSAPDLLAGLLVVGGLALITRAMHLDGLADTVDGLGCYGPPERALAVMRDGGAGPFAVVALVLVLGIQSVSFAALLAEHRLVAAALAITAGRAAFPLLCRRSYPAARPDGLGALVAGTQPPLVPITWWLLLTAAGVLATPHRPWQGPLAVLLAAVVVTLLARHARTRFGGLTGDVLGAASELATTTILAATTLTPPH